MKNPIRICTVAIFLTIWFTPPVHAQDGAEVFDIDKGEVVRAIPHSESLQQEAGKWLASIHGPIGRMRLDPDSGIGIKIELAPPQSIDTPWIKGMVSEVVLLIGKEKTYAPTLLVITREDRSAAFHIDYNLKPFLMKNKLYDPNLNLGTKPGESPDFAQDR